jgi:hypothetical protein
MQLYTCLGIMELACCATGLVLLTLPRPQWEGRQKPDSQQQQPHNLLLEAGAAAPRAAAGAAAQGARLWQWECKQGSDAQQQQEQQLPRLEPQQEPQLV